MEKLNLKQIVATLFCVAIGLLLATTTQAQVKIGDNPNEINEGAILELESDSLGVLFPRVYIENLATWAPLKGDPVEGMTVYNMEESTGKGFYAWKHSQWIKFQDSGNSIWKKMPNGNVELHDTNLKDSIQYTPLGFKMFDKHKRTFGFYNVKTSAYESTNTRSIPNANNSTVVASNTMRIGTLDKESLYANELNTIVSKDDTIGKTNTHFRDLQCAISIEQDNSKDYGGLTSFSSTSRHYGSGHVIRVRGEYVDGVTYPDASAKEVYGAMIYGATYSSKPTEYLTSVDANTVCSGNGDIGTVAGINVKVLGDHLYANAVINPTIGLLCGVRNTIKTTSEFQGTFSSVYGERIGFEVHPATNITDAYGLYVSDIPTHVTNNKFAIYTNAGKVRFGDVVETTSTIKVGSTTPATPEFGMIRYNSTIGLMEAYVEDANGDGTKDDPGWRVM